MKRLPRRLLDLALLLTAVAILLVLLLAPPATTPSLPTDAIHQPALDTALQQGGKTAERTCQTCHNPEQAPFSAGHPNGRRCLFCHRLPTAP